MSMQPEDFKSHEVDPEIAKIMANMGDQTIDGFSLIASENYPHPYDVLAYEEAMRAGFGGKYAEGYPSEKGPELGRYYQGVGPADNLENLARSRVIEVLARNQEDRGVFEANVQVPTGAGANISVFTSLMDLGDKMVAPDLAQGYGHLSHGAGVNPNIVGKMFKVRGYGINPDTGLLDYDELEKIVSEYRPKVVLGGASSYPRDIDWDRIAAIASEVGAVSVADISHPAGLIATNFLNDPVSAGIDVITTTTHKTMGGVKGAVIFWNPVAIEKKMPGKGMAINKGVFPGMWGGPNLATMAAHASTFRRAQTNGFREVQRKTQAGAEVLAKVLQDHGWRIVTGGTDNHLVLVDVVGSKLRNDATRDGWEAAKLLAAVGLIPNKNAVPGSNQIVGKDGAMRNAVPMRPAGLRLGTPAGATRGLRNQEWEQIGEWIHDTLSAAGDAAKLEAIRYEVRKLACQFPVPGYR